MARRRLTRLLMVATLALAALPTATASAARYDDWTPTSGSDPVETIADLEASADAIAPGAPGGASRVSLSLRSVVAQHLRISVYGSTGRRIRTIVDTDVAAGPGSWSWDGTDASGSDVADGTYEIVVEAGSANDSLSVSDIVRVDRRAPRIQAPTRTVRVGRGARTFALPIVASEQAVVDLSVTGARGRARATTGRAAGRSRLSVPIPRSSAMRRALRRGSARVVVRIVATDAAGNRSVRRVRVRLLRPTTTTVDTGGSGPSIGSVRISWPLSGPVTSGFGSRWGRNHDGIDLGVPTGRPIGAAAPGRVTYAGWMSGYGNCVIIDHGSGVSTLYGHQSRIRVHLGQQVTRGQVIGLVGSTGHSTGPHLHFEVRVGGTPRNPLTYLP